MDRRTFWFQSLTVEFGQALAREQQSFWQAAELAAGALEAYGPDGIEALAECCRQPTRRLRALANIAQQIELRVRDNFYYLPFRYFHVAADICRWFAEGTDQADPDWWLTESVRLHWSAERMLAEARSLTNVVELDAAQNARQRIVALVERYNAEHGSRLGATLSLETVSCAETSDSTPERTDSHVESRCSA